MRRLIKKSLAFALVASMVATMASSNMADAAKKVKLNKTTASIQVGQTVKIKVKNAKKSAKVTWKTSKKKVAKIKKSTKKGNAYATVVGAKTGKATITATYKVGKKKAQKLTCKVTVTKKSVVTPSQGPTTSSAPVVSTSPTVSAQPTQNVPTPTPEKTQRPSPTPKPPTPTPMPNEDYTFEKVEKGIAIDVEKFNNMTGSGAYNKTTGRVEINDKASSDASQGYWNLPDTIKIKDDDLVTFRVQGYNYGNSGFRFWIGDRNNGGCTPIILSNQIDENLAIDEEVGYPHVIKNEDGNEVKNWTVSNGTYTIDKNMDLTFDTETYSTLNQMALKYVNTEKKAFDVTFTFKAGTSQNDAQGQYPALVLKYINTGETVGYINGLCISNIYYIPNDAGDGPDDPTETQAPLPDLDPDAGEVSGQALAVKTDTAVTVDGVVDDAWDLADFVKVGYYSSGTPSETEAQAKFMWDADKLYVLAVVKDPEIDASAADADDYKRDGVEIFLDEDNSKEETYKDNSDAFQYRFTGFTKNADGDWLPALTKNMTTNKGAEANYEITSAYKVYDGGYVVEMAIPFKNTPDIATKDTLGFELTVMDCANGDRANEIWLTGTGDKLPDGKYQKEKMYENPSYFGEVKLVKPSLPEFDPEAGEVSGQALALKTDRAVKVDGIIDGAWKAAEFVKVSYYSGTKGDTEAQAKLMWDAENLYVLAVVKDPEIDATSGDDWLRDGVEVFFDEDCSRTGKYDANTDAFQYRFTGFAKDEDGVWQPAKTSQIASQGPATTNYKVKSAYRAYDGEGYVVEIAIPFKNPDEIEADKVLGFELTVMDCKKGKRNNEIWLTGTGDKLPDGKYQKSNMYDDTSLLGEVKLAAPGAEAAE